MACQHSAAAFPVAFKITFRRHISEEAFPLISADRYEICPCKGIIVIPQADRMAVMKFRVKRHKPPVGATHASPWFVGLCNQVKGEACLAPTFILLKSVI